MTENDRTYHARRARAELELAYQTQNKFVSDVHLQLAALHMGGRKALDDVCDGSRCSTERRR